MTTYVQSSKNNLCSSRNTKNSLTSTTQVWPFSPFRPNLLTSEWKKHAAHWLINSTKEVRDEVPISELHKLYKEEMEAINEVLERKNLSLFYKMVKIY